MKLFSLRNLLGVGAIYAATQYAKKNGGARNAFEGLVTKVRDAFNQKKEELIGKAHDSSFSPPVSSSSSRGFVGSDYSSDFNGGNRRS